MNLENKIAALEAKYGMTSEPFVLPVFTPVDLDGLFQHMASWGISRHRSGQLMLIDGKTLSSIGILEYNPNCLETLEDNLRTNS